MDITLKLGESSDITTITGDYYRPLPSNIGGYISIGDKSGTELKRIDLQKVPKINPETNTIEGFYLIFQVTPQLSEELGIGKFKYAIYIYTRDENGEIDFFKEYRTGNIVIKKKFVERPSTTIG